MDRARKKKVASKWSQFVMDLSLSRNFHGTGSVLRKLFFPETMLLATFLVVAPFNYCVKPTGLSENPEKSM